MLIVDAEIIAACLKQDAKAEYALYRYCFAQFSALCYRYTNNKDDAVDLLNKAFLKILTHLEKYDSEKPFDAWAKKIVMNTIIDEHRKQKRYKEDMQITDINELSAVYHPFDVNEAEAKISNKELMAYINKLPETSKMVLNLYVFDGLTHQQIAEELNISAGTSKWHLNNARGLLKKMMKHVLSTIKMYVL
jgi:RNA polymerase sigma factor (sigma-70 family)